MLENRIAQKSWQNDVVYRQNSKLISMISLTRLKCIFSMVSHVLLDFQPEGAKLSYQLGGQDFLNLANVAGDASRAFIEALKQNHVQRSVRSSLNYYNTDSCNTTKQQELSNSLQKSLPGSLTFFEAKTSFWNAYQNDAKNPVDPTHHPDSLKTLRYQMNKFDQLPEGNPIAGNIDELRAFIKTFYFSGCYTHMWQSLDVEGKEQFLKYFYSLLMAYLTGITPVNARTMLHLYENNKIIEHHGLVSVSYDEVTHRFQLLFSSGETLNAATLIDATGYRYKPDPNSVKPMLLDKLAKSGLISTKTNGGIHVTDHYQVIDVHGKVHQNLVCVGPVAHYNHPVPTPHSSFMVEHDLNLVMDHFAPMLLPETASEGREELARGFVM
ncbi:hypothetical protein Lqui_0297 [Legionella quinlivanii]|uniref:Uncharacterized protein n=1 Tax=Legionella quinlivanii TaxID=45073 RepID=A0A0W0Y340_9GAMM|nr:hypothetical protein [Legionella quinlivanii]KTD51453.1 hypothetical protein Lqui_0297 [Legionella quinlivanii]MCW8450798.1 hypothetical protein [Legionella quinlivanii]SEG44973.1 hypothetical protein SAMN02746093_02990 [Legionella quinlivanii DSM 21216]STY11022.1 Uncharacterized protein conserved in bacteria [Legionella quinlivanii]